jgi:hypothetical protein
MGHDANKEIRGFGVIGFTEKEATLRWHGYVIRRDEGEPVGDIME